jgi:hypothetical protein
MIQIKAIPTKAWHSRTGSELLEDQTRWRALLSGRESYGKRSGSRSALPLLLMPAKNLPPA